MRRVIALLIVVGLAIGLVVLVASALRTPSPKVVTLASGPELRLLGATYGTNHVSPGASRLMEFMPRPLRALIEQWTGGPRPIQRFSRSKPGLAVWFEESALSLSNRLGPLHFIALIADETGASAGDDQWHTLPPGGAGSPRPFWLDFRAVPKRSRLLTVRFYDEMSAPDRTAVGEVTLPNPTFSEWPVWEPEALPVARTNAELECFLSGVAAGVGFSTVSRSTRDGEEVVFEGAAHGFRPNAVGLFRFSNTGKPTQDWTVGTVKLSDATGNAVSCGSSSVRVFDDLIAFRFGPILWPSEVWDMEIWAKRTTDANYTEEELIVLENVPVPAPGATNRLDRAFSYQDIEVTVEEFARKPPPSPGGYSMRDLTHLKLQISELPEGHYLNILRIADDQDRELKGRGWSLSHAAPAEMVFAFEEVPEGAKTINFRLAIQEGRPFRFRVKPTLVSTNGLRFKVPRRSE